MAKNGTQQQREAALLAIFEGIDEGMRDVIRPLITETAYIRYTDGTTGKPLFVESNTAAISNGEAIAPGTNCTATTIVEQLEAIL